MCREVLTLAGLQGWQIGKTRVFLRAGQLAALEVICMSLNVYGFHKNRCAVAELADRQDGRLPARRPAGGARGLLASESSQNSLMKQLPVRLRGGLADRQDTRFPARRSAGGPSCLEVDAQALLRFPSTGTDRRHSTGSASRLARCPSFRLPNPGCAGLRTLRCWPQTLTPQKA